MGERSLVRRSGLVRIRMQAAEHVLAHPPRPAPRTTEPRQIATAGPCSRDVRRIALCALPLWLTLVFDVGARADPDGGPRTLDPDRRWDVLAAAAGTSSRNRLLQAGEELGGWRIELAGTTFDGPRLLKVARASPDARLVAALRDEFGRPIDVEDLLWFLDDVLAAGRRGLRGELVYVTSGRARSHGILLHPDDVFAGRPRRYGEHGVLPIDRPEPQRSDLPPAVDGDPPGPGWAMRYRDPVGEAAALSALTKKTGDPGFEQRLRALLTQLREQGAEVSVNSTVRSPERGYLMWGAFELGRAADEREFTQRLARLEARNREWKLDVPIRWRGDGDWQSARESAREMADTYEVVFATEGGARSSSHYGGRAVDVTALALPRRLTLTDPRGTTQVFDLSGVDEPLDLSLTPALIEWIEAHFGLRKLRSDYPHWDDAADSRSR